ncbi:MAG: acylneuraminate cytidylyltransferase family protein [Candidatus Sedimenticola sp. (ex Thyasira tokunagai)]
MTSSILGIIPARAGSRGIPHKNTALLAGKPLITYTLEAALNCMQIDHLVITTDCERVMGIGNEYGVEIIERPAELASATATSDAVVLHTLQALKSTGQTFDAFILLQPTSPLRTADDISFAIALFQEQQGKGSVVSVVRPDKHPMKSFELGQDHLQPWIDEQTLGSPRQLLPELVQSDGAIYITATERFIATNSFYSHPVTPYFIPKQHSIDVDGADDLELAAFYLSRTDRHS